MRDEDEENFIVTSRVLDQLAYRTTENQLKCLAKELKCKRSTVKKICNDHKETYNKCYAMLTKLMEKSDRKDWLFNKDCYKKIQGGIRITEEIEALINQGITIFYTFNFTAGRSRIRSRRPRIQALRKVFMVMDSLGSIIIKSIPLYFNTLGKKSKSSNLLKRIVPDSSSKLNFMLTLIPSFWCLYG